jgi:hypothetical protein
MNTAFENSLPFNYGDASASFEDLIQFHKPSEALPIAKTRKLSTRKNPFTLKVEDIQGTSHITLTQTSENVEHKIHIHHSAVPLLLKNLVDFSVYAYRKSLLDQINGSMGSTT